MEFKDELRNKSNKEIRDLMHNYSDDVKDIIVGSYLSFVRERYNLCVLELIDRFNRREFDSWIDILEA